MGCCGLSSLESRVWAISLLLAGADTSEHFGAMEFPTAALLFSSVMEIHPEVLVASATANNYQMYPGTWVIWCGVCYHIMLLVYI